MNFFARSRRILNKWKEQIVPLNSIKFVLISFCSLFLFISCTIKYNNPFDYRKYKHTELIEATKNPDWKIRRYAIISLREKATFGINKEMMELIVKDSCNPLKSLLDDDNWQVRRQAVYTLSTIICGDLTNSIISKLKDDKIEVQITAAYTLQMYPSKETIESLKKVRNESVSGFIASTSAIKLREQAKNSIQKIKRNREYMNKIQLTEFIEVPKIPDNFALIYIRCDAVGTRGAEFFVDQNQIVKLRKDEYTCFLVKKGKYRFHAKGTVPLSGMRAEINISLESGKIYNFHSISHYSVGGGTNLTPEQKYKYGSNAKKIIKNFRFFPGGSEKECITYSFRPPIVTKIEF